MTVDLIWGTTNIAQRTFDTFCLPSVLKFASLLIILNNFLSSFRQINTNYTYLIYAWRSFRAVSQTMVKTLLEIFILIHLYLVCNTHRSVRCEVQIALVNMQWSHCVCKVVKIMMKCDDFFGVPLSETSITPPCMNSTYYQSSFLVLASTALRICFD